MTKTHIRRLEQTYRRAIAGAETARDARDAGIRQARRDGYSLRDLADLLGVSRQYISKIDRKES